MSFRESNELRQLSRNDMSNIRIHTKIPTNHNNSNNSTGL